MTTQVVDDNTLDEKLDRKVTEISRRLREKTLDPTRVHRGLQLVIEDAIPESVLFFTKSTKRPLRQRVWFQLLVIAATALAVFGLSFVAGAGITGATVVGSFFGGCIFLIWFILSFTNWIFGDYYETEVS